MYVHDPLLRYTALTYHAQVLVREPSSAASGHDDGKARSQARAYGSLRMQNLVA